MNREAEAVKQQHTNCESGASRNGHKTLLLPKTKILFFYLYVLLIGWNVC